MRGDSRQRAFRPSVIWLGAALIVAILAAPVVALTTWNPGPGARSAARPKTCNDGAACTNNGGSFLSGNHSFALGFNSTGSVHYWYSGWTSDRPTGNSTRPQVPEESSCSNTANPATGITLTSATSATTTAAASSATTVAQSRSLVSATHVGSTATFTLSSAFSGSFNGVAKWDWITLSGVQEGGSASPAYNGTFQVIGVDSPTVIKVDLGTAPAGSADLATGTATIYRATYQHVAGPAFQPGNAVVVTGMTPAGYNSPTWLGPGEGQYWAYTVQSATATSFSVNVRSALGNSTVAGAWRQNTGTFTATANGLAVGDRFTISGATPTKYDGTWVVHTDTSNDVVTARIDTSPGVATGTMGRLTKAPYCSGVYFSRSTDAGTTWAAPISLGPLNTHADRLAIASGGSGSPNVYAAYVTTVGFEEAMCANAPRPLYFTMSNSYGATGSWSAPVLISGPNERASFPSISALGNNVYIAASETDPWQNPTAAGENARVKVYVSTNAGANFTQRTAGFTTSTYDNGTSRSQGCPGAPTPSSVEGFEPWVSVAGNGTHIGVVFDKNNDGKLMGKVSLNNGATWSGGCNEPTPNCTQVFAKAGGKGPIGHHTIENCPSYVASYNQPGACGLSNHAVAITGTGASTRIAFAWVNNDCSDSTLTGCVTGMMPGVYSRVWAAVGDWGVQGLISCFKSTSSCTGAPAASRYMDGYGVSLTWFGTNGLGLAWTGCRVGPAKACAGGAADPGDEIVIKESGNGGLGWAGDWAPPLPSSYDIVANDSLANSRFNRFPTLVYDRPGAAYMGCAQQANGAPEATCSKIVNYMGANRGYTLYQIFIQVGAIT